MHKASPVYLLALVLFAPLVHAACTAVAFEPRIDHPINTGSPYIGGVADANVDGRDDVTVYFNDSGGFRTYLSNPDATLAGGPLYSQPGISEAETGDIDGDGVPDVAHGAYVLDGSPNPQLHLQLFEGNGDGTYTLRNNLPQDLSPYEIEIADLNNDGRKDIVAGMGGGPKLIVLLQTGPWTFAAAPELTGGELRSVADLDGDGNLDLVLAAGDQDLRVFYGKGDGTFDPIQTIVLPKTPSVTFGAASVAASDFNFDGRVDLAAGIINFGAAVMINDGARTFHHAATVAPDAGARTVKAVDLNFDGRKDLAVSTFGGFVTALANADGTFAAPVFQQIPELGSGMNAGDRFSFKTGDFRGDGRVDLVGRVGVTFNSSFVATFLNACAPPPAVTSIEPDFGPEGGGTMVTIKGTSFLSTTQVLFGTAPATILTTTPTSLTVQTPAAAPNFVDVTVTTGGGSATVTNGFRYVGASTTAITAEPETIVAGTPFTLVATVAPARTGGTVTFTEGATVLGTAPVVNGRATISVTSASIAPRTFTAQFSGSPILDPSAGSGTFRAYLPVTVGLTISPSYVVIDSTYRVTARLTPPVNGGTVTFSVDGDVAGVVNVVNGVALLDLAAAEPGPHTVEAAFSGFGDYAPAHAVTALAIVAPVPALSELALLALMVAIAGLAVLRLTR